MLLQFLAESVLLSVIGGGLGVLAGLLASVIIAVTTHWPIPVSIPAVGRRIPVLGGRGDLLRLLPGAEGLATDPIEALRFE